MIEEHWGTMIFSACRKFFYSITIFLTQVFMVTTEIVYEELMYYTSIQLSHLKHLFRIADNVDDWGCI